MIRPAVAADIQPVADIYEEILSREERGPRYTQWVRGGYPTVDTARTALDNGWLYVLEEAGELRACAVFNRVQLPEYEQITWSLPARDEQVFVIHTLCVHPDRAGRGLARAMVAYAEELGRSLGCTVLRLDTNVKNLPAAAMYPKLGYRRAGMMSGLFQGVIPADLWAFEKSLI